MQAFPASSPQAEATSDLVRHLRDDLLPAAVGGTDTEVLVGGSTAAVTDFGDLQASRMPVFIGVVLLVSFVVLTAVFRSIAVALKAVVLNLLQDLKASLGEDYWMDAGVRDLQARLRSALGSYAAWAADKAPMHQRARLAARHEARFAHLLWPR